MIHLAQAVDKAQNEADGAGAMVGGSEQTPAKDMKSSSADSSLKGDKSSGSESGSGKESSPGQPGTQRHGDKGPSTVSLSPPGPHDRALQTDKVKRGELMRLLCTCDLQKATDVQESSDKYGNVVGSSEEQDKLKSKL